MKREVIMKVRGVLFDIDGTLVDSLELCLRAFQVALQELTGEWLPGPQITRYFGVSEEGILDRMVPQLPQAETVYFRVFTDLHQDLRESFPGMRELLARLQAAGVPMGVVTGKGARGAEIALKALGLQDFFPVVEAGSRLQADKPTSMRLALARLGLRPEECAYVGDTVYDMQSAAAVGMLPVGAAWAKTTNLRSEDPGEARLIFTRLADFYAWAEETLCPETVAGD